MELATAAKSDLDDNPQWLPPLPEEVQAAAAAEEAAALARQDSGAMPPSVPGDEGQSAAPSPRAVTFAPPEAAEEPGEDTGVLASLQTPEAGEAGRAATPPVDSEEVHSSDDEAASSTVQEKSEEQGEEGAGFAGTEAWRVTSEQRVAVLLVLGALQRWPHGQEQELRKRLERKVQSRLELCNVKGVGGRSFVLRSVFWPVALRGALDGDVPQWAQARPGRAWRGGAGPQSCR